MPLDMNDFIADHVRCRNGYHYRKGRYAYADLMKLFTMAKKILKSESTLVRISAPCRIVGAIFGRFDDLIRILCQTDGKSKQPAFLTEQFVFLGDYTSKEKQSLECLVFLLAIKCKFPTCYAMLRGEKEIQRDVTDKRFLYSVRRHFDKDQAPTIIAELNEIFTLLPLAALVSQKILCVHGGISPDLKSFKDIENIKRPLNKDDIERTPLIKDLIFAESSCSTLGYMKHPNPEKGVLFGPDVFLETCMRLDLSLAVTSSDGLRGGFGFCFHKKLAVLYSTPSYNPDYPEAATLQINKDGRVGLMALCRRPIKDGDTQKTTGATVSEKGKSVSGTAGRKK